MNLNHCFKVLHVFIIILMSGCSDNSTHSARDSSPANPPETNSSSNSIVAGSATSYPINARISGLEDGLSLTLVTNGSAAQRITHNGTFTIFNGIKAGDVYAVSIEKQPYWQTCLVSNGSGTVTNIVADVSISCSNSQASVSTLAGSSFSGSSNGTGTAAAFYNPGGIAIATSGNLYVADQSNQQIRKITPAGVVTAIAGIAKVSGFNNGDGTSALFRNPWGVFVDASENVYVADSNNNQIRKITLTGFVTTLAGSTTPGAVDGVSTLASFKVPYKIALDSSGNVFVADTFNHSIRKISPDGIVTTLAGSGAPGLSNGVGTSASFSRPSDLAVDTNGNLYVTDSGNNQIRKITPTGVVTTFAGSAVSGSKDETGTAASFNAPLGITIDTVGNIYVADTGNNKIRKITKAGLVTTLAGSGSPGLSDGSGLTASFGSPSGLAVDISGNIYVADSDNHKIRKISPIE